MKYSFKTILTFSIFIIAMSSCKTTKPELKVVKTVDLQKYAGTWYEISRLPNTFEEGLECITATYTILENGKIEVLNKGQRISDPSKIETAKGKAHIPNKNEPAKLKVTFFWPFYGNYYIMELDENYQYALVGDPSRKYLWVLARQKTVDEQTYKQLMDSAQKSGFDIAKVQMTTQNCTN